MADTRIRVVYEFGSKHQHCQIRFTACGRCVILPPALAIATFGATTGVEALEKRLRCQGCGAKQASVWGVYREYHG